MDASDAVIILWLVLICPGCIDGSQVGSSFTR